MVGRATFTIDDAKAAGLIRPGSAWQSHPARMLWARASKNAIVDFAPQVALGINLIDELQEFTGAPAVDDLEVEVEIVDGDGVEIQWPDSDEPVGD